MINIRLYACQCLEISYLVRHKERFFSDLCITKLKFEVKFIKKPRGFHIYKKNLPQYGVELGFNVTFNSVPFPTCDQSPDCSGKGEATEAAATTKAAPASETQSTVAASKTSATDAASVSETVISEITSEIFVTTATGIHP